MTTNIDLDFNSEHPAIMMDLLYMVERLGGVIVTFTACGPAGGNPNAIIAMPNKESALKVLTTYFDGDQEEAEAYFAD